jgi:hypothetical protein
VLHNGGWVLHKGLSGVVYPAGTEVVVTGRGASVDAFVGGDWLPLQWWEFAEGSGPARTRPP